MKLNSRAKYLFLGSKYLLPKNQENTCFDDNTCDKKAGAFLGLDIMKREPDGAAQNMRCDRFSCPNQATPTFES